jgi:hypothetical protein
VAIDIHHEGILARAAPDGTGDDAGEVDVLGAEGVEE